PVFFGQRARLIRKPKPLRSRSGLGIARLWMRMANLSLSTTARQTLDLRQQTASSKAQSNVMGWGIIVLHSGSQRSAAPLQLMQTIGEHLTIKTRMLE